MGLNLTAEVRDGILNHTGPNLPRTYEGRIVRTADRIAYLCHDYDDSIRAGLLLPGELPPEVQERFGTDTSRMITTMVADMIETSMEQGQIAMSPEVSHVMDVFRRFMFQHIYHSEALARERRQAVFVLKELYGYYMENFHELPDEFVKRETSWGRQQTVVDYVAGLTDGYAVQLFKQIFVPPAEQMV